MQSLQLGSAPLGDGKPQHIQRLNRLPIIVVVVLTALFCAVIIYGLSSRGLRFHADPGIDAMAKNPASTYADQMKQGVSNGIIGEPKQDLFQPAPTKLGSADQGEKSRPLIRPEPLYLQRATDNENDWLVQLKREQNEQYLRELQRQKMARLQAKSAALDSPLAVDVRNKNAAIGKPSSDDNQNANDSSYVPISNVQAMRPDLVAPDFDPNRQRNKTAFLNQNIEENGTLSNTISPQRFAFELKRGSVIPATLVTGVNSDLPGRIIAQVSRHVFDSATGHHLLIPQGTKLFGRYDSDIAFSQSRVLVVWTDMILPNGSTLEINGMAGADVEGYGGFKDKVDHHYLKTFGSAALLALIGTGIDMAVPESSTAAMQETASDAARRNFAETFGRVVEKSIDKNMSVQPTLEIRPGYQFNVLVDRDITFPSNYRG